MKYPIFIFSLFLLTSSINKKEEWTNLIDNKLSNWETYLSFRHSTSYNGTAPIDESGKPIDPIGYNKPNSVFTIVEEAGEPLIKVSGEIYGCIFTKNEYENYHLKLKVKFGEKKSVPRTDKLKDSGILYHSIGEAGVDYWRAWMLSQEFQIMEGHIGDYWSIANSAIDIKAYLPEGKMNSIASETQGFLAFGSGESQGYCMRSENHQTPGNDWTSVELICYKDKSLHIVNGHVVMILKNSRYVKDGKSFPLTKGKIQLQSEAAEVYYKDIQIKGIDGLPKEFDSFF
jgi:hypothetical protein